MPTQSALNRRSTFVLVGMIVALSAIAATAYALWRLRAETIDRQLETAALTARALEDHLTQSFNVIDRTLVNVAEEYGNAAKPSSTLSIALRQAPYLRSIAVIGQQEGRASVKAAGKVADFVRDKTAIIATSSTRRNVGVAVEQSDFLPQAADWVDGLRVGALHDGRDFYEARPLSPQNPNPAISFIPVARDVRRTDEQWTTVLASVNSDYFLNFYGSHISPDKGRVQLLRYDGRLLLSTDERDLPGTPCNSKSILDGVVESEVGRFEERLDHGQTVLTAYRASRAYPFILLVRLDKEQALADWREEASRTFGIVSAVLLAALALASLYFVRFERVARQQERDQERLRIAAIAFEAQEGMIVTSAQALVLQVNQAFTEITGYTSADAVGQNMNFLKSGLHDAAFYAHIRATVERSGAWSGEILNRHKDGSIHPHFLSVSAVSGDVGGPSHYVGTLTDISERKRAEESLRTLSRAVEQSPVSIVITDQDGNIQYVNPKFEAITGYVMAEVLGQNPRILSSKEKSSQEYREMWATLTSGNAWQGEFHNRRKDGTFFWEQASISPVFNDQGVLLHFVAVKEDITERKQANEKISELNRDFVSFLENSSDFIYFKDKNSRFRFCSQTLADITGHASWRDMIGKHDLEVFPKDTAQIYYEEELPIFQEGKVLINKIDPYFDASGKPGWVSTNKWPLLDREGKVEGLFGISRDITERKLADAELLRSNSELEQFSYSISHDMRQPLRMISSYLQLLERSLAERIDSSQREYFDFAIDGAKRLDSMMLGLLDYSRVGRKGEPPTWIESRSVLDEALLYLQPTVAEAQAEVRIEGAWPRIRVSPNEMLRLVQNLIANALKFRVAERRPEIFVRSEIVGNAWRLHVADNGVGIAPEQIGRLFQVFQRLHSRATYEGTGIGLALCRKIAEHHSGRIWVESAGEGLGANFYVEIPLTNEVETVETVQA